MRHQLRQRLLSAETLIGTIVTFSAPEVAEVLVNAGFDWLFIDTEHAPFDAQAAQGLLQAAGACPGLVRVSCLDETRIKKMLDIGAAGIIVPQVSSAADAELAVRFSKYPPAGTRGVGVARAQAYGLDLADYVRNANDELAVVIQAEHIDAVENIDAIVKVPGIDAVFIGPYDLSASMGKTGKLDDPEVVNAITRVRESCLAAGMRLGIFGVDSAALAPYIAQGYSLIAVGIDSLMLGTTAKALISELRMK